jgi:phosphotransferase family enzyme
VTYLEEYTGHRERLGWALPSARELRSTVRAVLDRQDAEVIDWWVDPVDVALTQPVTAGVHRVRGIAATSTGMIPWSVFVKRVHSFRHVELPAGMPDGLLDWATRVSPWDYEVDVYWSDLHDLLPAGLRLPRLYRVHDGGDERLALWLEDVQTVPDAVWDLPRFERAATLLGRLAARLTLADALPTSASRTPGEVTRLAYEGPVRLMALPPLLDEATWRHPLLAGRDPALPADLAELAGRLPRLLARIQRLPQALMHGDAAPQNLLVPADDPGGFVAVDWSTGGLAPVGYDLGQLLIGMAHAGRLSVEDLPEISGTIVPAYAAGLAWDGMPVDVRAVQLGFEAVLVLRSAFLALPLDRLGEPPSDELERLVTDRLALTRYLVDLGLSL